MRDEGREEIAGEPPSRGLRVLAGRIEELHGAQCADAALWSVRPCPIPYHRDDLDLLRGTVNADYVNCRNNELDVPLELLQRLIHLRNVVSRR